MVEQIKELQAIVLSILLDVDKVCKKHNITYYLGEGSLLGAIRHKGFIPWDDDLDILMRRTDYEKFLEIAPKEMGPNYEIQHPTTVYSYWSPFIKVRLLGNQKYRQKHIAHLTNNNGPYIDVFPMETVPKQKSIGQMWQGLKINFLRAMLTYKLVLRKPDTVKRKLITVSSKFLSVETIHRLLDKNFKWYNDRKDNKYTVTLASYHNMFRQTVRNEVYGEPVLVEFEGHLFPAPRQYDYLLRRIYGDYTKLPPKEKRKFKHHFIVVEDGAVVDK